jgi:hypothetical protein
MNIKHISLNLVIAILLLFATGSCKKAALSTLPLAPVLTGNTVATMTTATLSNTAPSDGGAAITQRGVCWSKTSSPTISDNKTHDGTGTGSFTSTITGLSSATTYYLRAYATNSVGTAYGEQIIIITVAETPAPLPPF